jgi:plastocyanin domain-containing protein
MFSDLGTAPLMFGFGAISSLLSGKFDHGMMKVSAVLVIALGVLMFSRGLNLSGISTAAYANSESGSAAQVQDNVQNVSTTLTGGRYSPIIVQSGIPVVWTIKANQQDLNGCNDQLTIPAYNIQKKLVPGDNIIKFTPTTTGVITYTCWMGMVSSTISIVPDINNVASNDIQVSQAPSAQAPNQGSQGLGGLLGRSCCGGGAPSPVNKNSPIQVAQIENGIQEVTVNVSAQGYSPAIIVLQKGVPFQIKFNAAQLDGCDDQVVFPSLQGSLNLQQGQTETPSLKTGQDFTFECGMGMLQGYAKVVDDIHNVNIQEIRNEIGD